MSAEIKKPNVIAVLLTLDLGRLRAGDAEESQKLLFNCINYGFMHLDLRSDPEFEAEWEKLLAVMTLPSRWMSRCGMTRAP